jgi:hypothetical protein
MPSYVRFLCAEIPPPNRSRSDPHVYIIAETAGHPSENLQITFFAPESPNKPPKANMSEKKRRKANKLGSHMSGA